MLTEAIDRIASLAREATSVQLLTHELLPDQVCQRVGDSAEWLPAPPPPRSGDLHGLNDVLAAASDMAPSPEVYHDTGLVTLLLNRQDRREKMIVPLHLSKRYQTVAALAAGRDFDVPAAVKFLRFELHGTNVGHVIDAISRIDFTRRSEGHASVEHGRETLGNSVEAAIQQADNVPEAFRVSVDVYTNPGFRYTIQIECGVYIDLAAQKVHLRTLADELALAEDATQAFIHEQLTGNLPDGTPVYEGRPG